MKKAPLILAVLWGITCGGTTSDPPLPDTANPPTNDTMIPSDDVLLPPDGGARPEDVPPPDAECIPNCDNKSCGDDGCGGECKGMCGAECDPITGQCIDECIPVCGGKSCGEDQCGGNCGKCTSPLMCDPEKFKCVACEPACETIECGPEPVCQTDCGTCPNGPCNLETGLCEEDTTTVDACTNEEDSLLNDKAMKTALECAKSPDVVPTPAAIASCLTAGIDLSEQCAACYGDLVGCMVSLCDIVCSSQSPECVQCLVNNNCASSFNTCAGIDLFETTSPAPNP